MEIKKISPLHPAPIQKWCGLYIFKYYQCWCKTCTDVLSVFWVFGSNPRTFIFLYNSNLFLCLGTQRSNTGEELVYYYVYHEEASFYLDVYPQLFNGKFIVYILSSQEHITIQKNFFCTFIRHSINRQEIFKINRMDYDKIHQ